MAMPSYPHIHLRDIGTASVGFLAPARGGPPRRPDPVADRPRHAERLRAGLLEVAEEFPDLAAAQARLGITAPRRGLALAALGRSGEHLVTGDVKATSPGLSLLGLKRGGSVEEPDTATLFVGERSLRTLMAALDRYAEWTDEAEDAGERRPRRFWLFESAEAFRAAGVDDLWTGPSPLPEGPGIRLVEAWLRLDRIEDFYRAAADLDIPLRGSATRFVDSAVIDLALSRSQMAALARVSGAVVEFRGASDFVTDYFELEPEGRPGAVRALGALVGPPDPDAPRTVLLDSGVNHANELLSAALPQGRCHTVRADWGRDDHSGHGTNMAGVALYGDLAGLAAARAPFRLPIGLESVKILRRPEVPTMVAPREAVEAAVGIVEAQAPEVRRVFCLAATTHGEPDDGQQTATSATIDKLAWNQGGGTRLFCIAAGNVPTDAYNPYETLHYPDRNRLHPVQTPGQALNALTVGGSTEKCSDPGGRTLAPQGDLSPTSRTAQAWDARKRHGNKPDVVFEAGNHVLDPGGATSRHTRHTRILTTGPNHPVQPLGLTGETSAATAAVAGMMTRLLARYPLMRAESARALATNCAEWTPAMLAMAARAQAAGAAGADCWAPVLDCFGWGVPNEVRLAESAGNALTLVIEDGMQPYARRGGGVVLNEMKYFALPWPRDTLRALRNEEVELRCTLSYFVEPDPLADRRDRRDRYASHRLRFRLNQPGDTPEVAQSRVNALIELEDDAFVASAAGDRNWLLGQRRRDVGSLHQDIWRGPAYQLADRGGLCVFPVKGWWAGRQDPAVHARTVPFTLVLSIRTGRADVDLYAEAMAVAPARNRVFVPVVT